MRASDASLFELGERYFESFEQLEAVDADIVLDVQQDARGFIWLATQKGLIRYDGYDFKPYVFSEQDPTSISGDYIQAIHFVGDKMWVGTYSDGISVFDPLTEAFSRIQHDPTDPDSLAENDIRSIVSNDHWIVVATRSGINLVDRATGQLRLLGNVVGCEAFLAKGKLASLALAEKLLLIGSSHGLCRVKLDDKGLGKPTLSGEPVAAMSEMRVFNIDILVDGRAWISTTNNGIAVMDLDSSSVRWIEVDAANPDNLNHLWVDDTTLVQGEIWAATAGAGIAVIDADSLRVKEHITHQPTNPSSLVMNDVSAIHVDNAGLVWVGTWGGGMSRFNPANRAFRALKQNPFDPQALVESDIRSAREMRNGEVWLGGAARGIQVVRPGHGLIKHYPAQPGTEGALQSGYIFAFEQMPDGDIWIATNQTGVYRYDADSDSFTRFTTAQGLTDDSIRTLHATDAETLWIGTDAGLTRLDIATERFTEVGARDASDTVRSAAVETITSYRGDLWVGTNSGLFVIPKGGTELIPVQSDPAHALADNFVADLLVDSADRLWVVSGQGIDILEHWDGHTARFLSVNDKLGLPAESLGEAIEEDVAGRLWAQSTLIDPVAWTATRIERTAGWDVGNQWIGSNAQLRDGTILFGGTRGLLMVRPQDYQRSLHQPRIAVTRSEVDSSSISLAQLTPLILRPQVKNFFVEFSALDFSRESNHRYEYKLEGYDDEWVSTDSRNRRASYSRLSPGDYVLKIRSLGVDGVSRSENIAINIQQMPAWYQTLWFQALVLLGLLFLVYGFVRWRVALVEKQKHALDALVERRTENIRQLGQAGQDITASLDLDQVTKTVYRHLSVFMDTSIFALGLVDEQSQTIEGMLHYQDGKRAPDFNRQLDDERSPAVWCINNRKPLSVPDHDASDAPPQGFKLMERERAVRSFVFYPLVFNEKVLGFLSLQSYKPSAYEANELEMLKTITAYTAIAIENARSHNRLNTAKAEIEKTSLTDQLTGLRNRRFLENLMPGEVSRLQRLVAEGSSERLGLLMVDADYFKRVNDNYGHDSGDAVLVQFAQVISAVCRDMDWAVRLGGEEFLVVARVTSREQLMLLAERIRASIEEHPFRIDDNTILRNTCSIGVCQFPFVAEATAAVSWEKSIKLADSALYLAKKAGRNQWVAAFEHAIDQPHGFYTRAVADLQTAADAGQIQLFSSLSKTL